MRTELYGHSHRDKCIGIHRAEIDNERKRGSLLGAWMGTVGVIDARDSDGGIWHGPLSLVLGQVRLGST